MKTKLNKYSRISSLVSVIGIIIFGFTFYYTVFNLNKKQSELNSVQKKLDTLTVIHDSIVDRISDLTKAQNSLLDFIGSSLSDKSINRIQYGIDWEDIKNNIVNLPSGKRKQAVLNAILLSWKEIPFTLGQNNLGSGFDSPGYIEYVLNSVNIEIVKKENLLLSQNIMATFKQTDNPEAGDLMFYKGQQGNFGLIYLGEGDENSEGIGIGTLQRISPIGVYKYINTLHFPFIGYYKVDYESYDNAR